VVNLSAQLLSIYSSRAAATYFGALARARETLPVRNGRRLLRSIEPRVNALP
jgi:hypothetical protein